MREEIILASKSPFRAELLAHAGLEVKICPANIDERAIETGFAAQKDFAPQLAQKLAQEKALGISRHFPQAFVIGCDQILRFDGQILHKVNNEAEAVERLMTLSGKIHTLYSAFSIAKGGSILSSFYDKADMTMRNLSKDAIRLYLKKAETSVLQSVGVYQIEGAGIRLFEEIKGDYFSIIGLPILPLLRELRKLNLIKD